MMGLKTNQNAPRPSEHPPVRGNNDVSVQQCKGGFLPETILLTPRDYIGENHDEEFCRYSQ